MTVEVDKYLASLTGDQLAEYERIRGIVLEIAPDATIGISYGMPAFKLHNKYLIGFAVFKQHLSLFPGAQPIADLQAELSDYKLSKGTIQYTIGAKIPDELVRAVVRSAMQRIG